MEVDYAVTIPGHNLKPTIQNGEVVLAKKADCLKRNDIGIFIIDGFIICERYITS